MSTCTQKEMCDALLKYYNTSILSNIDESLKESCYVEAEKCTGGTLERIVLKSLIINHKNQKKPIAKYIAGPYSLSLQWSAEFKKLIYIFGEMHNSETDCDYYHEKGKTGQMLIEDYLEQLFNYSDVFIDFYHEYHGYYKTSDYEDPTENMKFKRSYKIWEKIKTCVHKSTRDLPGNNCQKGRMHYIDIRTMNGIKVNNSSAFINLYVKSTFKGNVTGKSVDDLIKSFDEFFDDKQVIKLLEDLNTYTRTNKDFLSFFKDEFNHYEIYMKQVGNSNIKDEIKKFIEDKIDKIDTKIIELIFIFTEKIIKLKNEYNENKATRKIIKDEDKLKMIEELLIENFTELEGCIGILSEQLTEINYLIVDGYLLGRIFKTFDIYTTDPKKQRPTDEPEEPHNIIIYAGIYHSNNYRRFLNNIGFKTIAYAGPGKKWQEFDEEIDETKLNPKPANCIDMKFFQQPFFSNMGNVNWLPNKSNREEDLDLDKETNKNKKMRR